MLLWLFPVSDFKDDVGLRVIVLVHVKSLKATVVNVSPSLPLREKKIYQLLHSPLVSTSFVAQVTEHKDF